ncbi:MAG: helix-turn-helix domain-containing protein [Caulobacteraceae bacterium]|nr:helix-turn-helix domain-containing protein [Caulobacteraceae bacterium]
MRTAQRPKTVLAPDASLGQRLSFRRHQLEHRMIDAAAIASVDPKTWMWWESDEREPYVHQYPTIIQYLGYEPWPDTITLGERLLAKRRRKGLSIKRAAEITGVDEGTFSRWESGEWKPQSRSLPLIGGFLDWSC